MNFLHAWNPKKLRLPNPSRGTWIALGVGVAVLGGGYLYFRSRRAAAAEGAATAFEVADDCSHIEVIDESAARQSVTAAAIAVHPSPSAPAVGAVSEILEVLFPSCDWSTIADDTTFIHGNTEYTWRDVKPLLVGKTVSEISSMVTGVAGGIGSSPLPPFFAWMLAGGQIATR